MTINEQVCPELEEMRDYVKVRNTHSLRDISNKFTSDLMIFHDYSFRDIAILSLVLAKVLEKPRFWRYSQWRKIVFHIEDEINKMCEECRKKEYSDLKNRIHELIEYLEKIDRRDKRYIHGLIHNAKTKVGGTLYAKGVSLGKASFLSGANKEDILKYSGNTLISDRFGKTYSILGRVKYVRRLFHNKS